MWDWRPVSSKAPKNARWNPGGQWSVARESFYCVFINRYVDFCGVMLICASESPIWHISLGRHSVHSGPLSFSMPMSVQQRSSCETYTTKPKFTVLSTFFCRRRLERLKYQGPVAMRYTFGTQRTVEAQAVARRIQHWPSGSKKSLYVCCRYSADMSL